MALLSPSDKVNSGEKVQISDKVDELIRITTDLTIYYWPEDLLSAACEPDRAALPGLPVLAGW